MIIFRIILHLLILVFLGCAHPISDAMRKRIDPSLSFSSIFQAPDSFRDKLVMFGGEIVQTRNFQEGTEIEVVQKSLDSRGYPKSGDVTGGRFIFFKKGYLESEIYFKGRKIVGVGKIKDSITKQVDEIDYRYPVVEAEELHLWEKATPSKPYYPSSYWHPFHYRHRHYYSDPFYYW